jgi:hypothetical protein
MAKRVLMGMLCSLLFSVNLTAQLVSTCPYTGHQNSLACLIPDVTRSGKSGNGLSDFNTTIAQVLGQLPLAVPVSGFVLGFNAKLGIPVEISENLGSVLTERGNTVGKNKVFLGFTYQRFVFQAVDGVRLNNLPLVSLTGNGTELQFAPTKLSANISQYTGIIAFGLTDRIDFSATVPFERVSLGGAYTSRLVAPIANPQNVTQFSPVSVSGSASGIGDLILNLKGTVVSGEQSKVAMGMESRFPTGDVYNLLGSGAYGVKPYVVFSRYSGRYTPHVNLGYQWNGFSVLHINSCFFLAPGAAGSCNSANGTGLPTLRLPDSLDYSAGMDVGLVPKRLSAVIDIVGQRFFNAPRATKAGSIPGVTVPNSDFSMSVGVANSSYFADNASIGLKFNPAGHLIVSANALIRLDNAGLRPDRFVPLVGLSYRF